MPPFIPLPRFMLAGEYSINAKLLYGLLLMGRSAKNYTYDDNEGECL